MMILPDNFFCFASATVAVLLLLLYSLRAFLTGRLHRLVGGAIRVAVAVLGGCLCGGVAMAMSYGWVPAYSRAAAGGSLDVLTDPGVLGAAELVPYFGVPLVGALVVALSWRLWKRASGPYGKARLTCCLLGLVPGVLTVTMLVEVLPHLHQIAAGADSFSRLLTCHLSAQYIFLLSVSTVFMIVPLWIGRSDGHSLIHLAMFIIALSLAVFVWVHMFLPAPAAGPFAEGMKTAFACLLSGAGFFLVLFCLGRSRREKCPLLALILVGLHAVACAASVMLTSRARGHLEAYQREEAALFRTSRGHDGP